MMEEKPPLESPQLGPLTTSPPEIKQNIVIFGDILK
jgi:hypothetical protein